MYLVIFLLLGIVGLSLFATIFSIVTKSNMKKELRMLDKRIYSIKEIALEKKKDINANQSYYDGIIEMCDVYGKEIRLLSL